MGCLDGTAAAASVLGGGAPFLDVSDLNAKLGLFEEEEEEPSAAAAGAAAVELRHLTAALQCRDCGTKDCMNWVVDADGTPSCAACRLHRDLVAKRSERHAAGNEEEEEAAEEEVVVVGGDRVGEGIDAEPKSKSSESSAVATATSTRRRKRMPKKPGRKPKAIFCPLCESEFRNKKAYVDHVVLAHDNAIKFACQQPGCAKVYPKKQTLKIHMAQVHRLGETPFVCKFCRKSFATLGAAMVAITRLNAI